MNAPVAWMSPVELYLACRRRPGFKLTINETRLKSFTRFADELAT
jgi:hypothetical protein